MACNNSSMSYFVKGSFDYHHDKSFLLIYDIRYGEVEIMKYTVEITYGPGEGTSSHEVTNVSDIQFYNESYYFTNAENDVLFIAPIKSVLYITKN